MENEKFNIVKALFEWVEEIVYASIVVIVVFTFLFKVVTVNGISMLPNFVENDKLVATSPIIHKDVEKGDVVVIVGAIEKPIIKRVIATEGQEVNIDTENGIVYIDGKALDESQYGIENGITKQIYSSLDLTTLPQVVPEGHVFVLGDNRPNSEDSRYEEIGMVDERKIIGIVDLRIYPFDTFGLLN